MSRSALLLGATGLIGGCVLDYLLADESYERVTTIGRRKIDGLERHRKLTQLVADLETVLALSPDAKSDAAIELLPAFEKSDDIFCTLGTTMKKAGSKAAFEKVDYHYPLKAAELGIAPGAKRNSKQFLIVTALGADANSTIYYNKIKGRVEQALLEYQYHAIHIFQPSLLTGDRRESRLGEDIGKAVGGVLGLAMIGPLKKYKPIPGRSVARAMLAAARKADSGVHSYESDTIFEMVE